MTDSGDGSLELPEEVLRCYEDDERQALIDLGILRTQSDEDKLYSFFMMSKRSQEYKDALKLRIEVGQITNLWNYRMSSTEYDIDTFTYVDASHDGVDMERYVSLYVRGVLGTAIDGSDLNEDQIDRAIANSNVDFGFWSSKERPEIVASASAIIPDLEIIMDVYTVKRSKDIPKKLPWFAEDVMALRLLAMESHPLVRSGVVFFVKESLDQKQIQKNERFMEAFHFQLDESKRDTLMTEKWRILKNHYLLKVLPGIVASGSHHQTAPAQPIQPTDNVNQTKRFSFPPPSFEFHERGCLCVPSSETPWQHCGTFDWKFAIKRLDEGVEPHIVVLSKSGGEWGKITREEVQSKENEEPQPHKYALKLSGKMRASKVSSDIEDILDLVTISPVKYRISPSDGDKVLIISQPLDVTLNDIIKNGVGLHEEGTLVSRLFGSNGCRFKVRMQNGTHRTINSLRCVKADREAYEDILHEGQDFNFTRGLKDEPSHRCWAFPGFALSIKDILDLFQEGKQWPLTERRTTYKVEGRLKDMAKCIVRGVSEVLDQECILNGDALREKYDCMKDILEKYKSVSNQHNCCGETTKSLAKATLCCSFGESRGDGKRFTYKTGCPMVLKVTWYASLNDGDALATCASVATVISQQGDHEKHDPGSCTDQMKRGKASKKAIAIMNRMFSLGNAKPMNVYCTVKFKDSEIPKADKDTLTIKMVQNAARNFYASQRLDDDDFTAVEKIVSSLTYNNAFLYSIMGSETQKRNFQIAICTVEQQAVLRACHRMIFMDSCYCLNKYGQVLLAMVCRDPYGHGFPVAFAIVDQENANTWKTFINAVLTKCDLNNKKENITFMIDKCKKSMKALTSLGCDFILCAFHVLEAIQKRLKESRVDETLKWRILSWVTELRLTRDSDAFDNLATRFIEWLKENKLEALCKYFKDNWLLSTRENGKVNKCGTPSLWAAYGREHVKDMNSNTNNFTESFFSTLKRAWFRGRRMQRLDSEIMVFLDGVVPYYTANLRERLMGITTTLSARNQASYEVQMSQLVVKNYSGKEVPSQYTSIFREVIDGNTSQSFTVCLGDLSCTCRDNETDVCMHIERAMENTGLEIGLIRTTSSWISICHNEGRKDLVGNMQEMEIPFLRHIPTPSAETSDPTCPENLLDNILQALPTCFFPRPGAEHAKKSRRYYINLDVGSCTCNAYSKFNICPHIDAFDTNNEDNISLEEIIAWPEKQCIAVKRNRHINEECETKLKDIFLMDANMPYQSDMSQPIVRSGGNDPLESVLNTIRKNAKRIVDPVEKADIIAGLHSFLNIRILPKVPSKEAVVENQERYRSHDDPNNRNFRPRQQQRSRGGHSSTLGKRPHP